MAEIQKSITHVSTANVRALPGGYFVISFVGTFVAALSAYLDLTTFALTTIFISWLIVPLLWLTDKIAFDGRRIRRTGLLPYLLARATGTRDRLKISDIEQIETAVFRGIKRGRNVYYTYRTTVSGKTAQFVFSSGHRGYRNVIKALFPKLDEDVLDNTSIDLRDYLAEKSDVGRRARESDIPSSDVLDSSFTDIHVGSGIDDHGDADQQTEKASHLQRLANELRVSGRLLQALEAFRRAAILRPRDARLLFEFAECVRLVAGSEGDEKMERRASAMMRLAERHAASDRDLLSRIGEAYFRVGDWRRAAIVFRRISDAFGENFRAARGLAELALRDGRLAHVIHNFAVAERAAATTALRRWTRSEVDYFSHLNNDDEYMELEISRVNLLDTLGRTKGSSVRVALLGFILIGLGLGLGDGLIANLGWAVSGISLLLWVVTILMTKMLSPRIPFEMMETDE